MSNVQSPLEKVKQNRSTIAVETIPSELKALRQWVNWRYVPRNPTKTNPDPKPMKVPLNPKTSLKADPTDSTTWYTYDQAITTARNYPGIAGIGFVFANNGYVGIDLDDCIQNGVLKPEARRILTLLNSYTELSPSGTGLHVIVKGHKPDTRCRPPKAIHNDTHSGFVGIEVYDSGRYLTMTGNVFEQYSSIEKRDLAEFYRLYFGEEEPPAPAAQPRSVPLDIDDQTLLEKAMKNPIHELGVKFQALWNGDMSVCNNDASAADYNLLCQLAFWTGKDEERMYHLFCQSGLYREKTNGRRGNSTYIRDTIKKAIKHTAAAYDPSYRSPQSSPSQHPKSEIDFSTHPTDLGNAKRLVKQYHKKIRFCPEYDRWLLWTGQRWKQDSKQRTRMIKYAKEVVKSLYGECARLDTSTARKVLSKWAQQSEAKKHLLDMIFLAQSEDEIEVSQQELDQDAYLLNCRNGVIDLRTGELLPHSPTHYVTKMVPVTYNPHAECFTWEDFLFKIMDGFRDPERAARMINFLQRAIGYTLTGDISEQCLFFLYGTGQNGKSVFTNILTTLLGDYFQHVRIESLLAKRYDTIPNDLAQLPGSRLVVTSETPENRKLNESLVKDLTGGDAITARFLQQEFFTFHPVFKLWIFGNYKPIISPDDAIFRRIKLIPFTVKIRKEEQIPQAKLEEMLKAELSGVLNWAVEGCLKWQHEGLNVPQDVIDATNEYRNEMDMLTDFVDDRCLITPVAKVKKGVLYSTFEEWCKSLGIKPIGSRTFSSRLRRRFPNITDGKGTQGTRYWYGIGLQQEEDERYR